MAERLLRGALYARLADWEPFKRDPCPRCFDRPFPVKKMLPLRVPQLHFSFQPKYLLRALGLELVNSFCRRWSGPESPKPFIERSRWVALSRCAIHLFPTVVTLFLIPLNFQAMYIGPGFSYRTSPGLYLVLFRIGAKLLE